VQPAHGNSVSDPIVEAMLLVYFHNIARHMMMELNIIKTIILNCDIKQPARHDGIIVIISVCVD